MLDVILHRGRDRSVRRRHPWLMSGAVAQVLGDALPGALARVLSNDGEVLGHGHVSPRSSVRVRMIAFGKEPIDEAALIVAAVARANALRTPELCGETDAVRLVNAEGDGLPGLIVDRYGDVLVAGVSTAGMDRVRPLWNDALRVRTGADSGLERTSSAAARREGFAAPSAPLWGEPPDRVVLRERAREYVVDLRGGQGTGFYLDRRSARDRVEGLARGRRVLDLFCYTGGFAAAAARGGARSVTAVDTSESALRLARENLERTGAAIVPSVLRADAFRFMRGCEDPFDLIVIDPPPLARTRRDIGKATRAYKDVALHSLRRAAPGALGLFFAGSHHLDAELLRKVVFGASLDAGRSLQVLEEIGAAPDHPVSLDHPEGRGLTGLLTRVVPQP